jgi:hypothetical protein
VRSEISEGVTRVADERSPSSRRGRTPLALAVWALLALAGFAAYLGLARTRAVNSDGASQALQAWDMLHGNPMLRGWFLSDVSFYTTELPQYMLVEAIRGLNAGVVDIAAASTYTLAVLFAALVARGTATGREGIARACLAVLIMLAPQLGDGTNVLISSPDHIGTSVPVLAAWLILDRAGRRWPAAVAISLLLGWAVVADTLVLYVAVIPLVLACGWRVLAALWSRRRPEWFELGLAAGAAACAALALGALRLIHAAGGFYVAAPSAQTASLGIVWHVHLRLTGQGLLLLFGASFLGLRSHLDYALAALHLVGVVLVATGFLVAVWRWRRQDLVTRAIVIGIGVNLVTYTISTSAIFVATAREFAPVLPLSAALAGRELGPWLARRAAGRARRVTASLLVLAGTGYLAGLVHEALQPAVPAQNAALPSWLAAHHLTDGLSGYWEANVVTLASGNRVRIRRVEVPGGSVVRVDHETNATWYDPNRYSANFIVFFPGVPGTPGTPGYPGFTDTAAALATFGKPARVLHDGAYTIWVWNKNLLTQLG